MPGCVCVCVRHSNVLYSHSLQCKWDGCWQIVDISTYLLCNGCIMINASYYNLEKYINPVSVTATHTHTNCLDNQIFFSFD